MTMQRSSNEFQMGRKVPAYRFWSTTTTHCTSHYKADDAAKAREAKEEADRQQQQQQKNKKEGEREEGIPPRHRSSNRSTCNIGMIFFIVLFWFMLPMGLSAHHHHHLLGAGTTPRPSAAGSGDASPSPTTTSTTTKTSIPGEPMPLFEGAGDPENYFMTLQGMGVMLPWSRCQCLPVLPFPPVVVDEDGDNDDLRKNLTDNFTSNPFVSEWERQEYIMKAKHAMDEAPPSGVYAVTVEAREVVKAMVAALNNLTQEQFVEMRSQQGGTLFQILKLKDQLDRAEKTLRDMNSRTYKLVDFYWGAIITMVLLYKCWAFWCWYFAFKYFQYKSNLILAYVRKDPDQLLGREMTNEESGVGDGPNFRIGRP